MKGARTPAGYTIVEVMIVLAVSGMMFLIAANFIGGKQEATSFPQGVNALASSLQNTIEQVSDGQYSDVNLTCSFQYNPIDTQSSFIYNLGLNAIEGNTTTNSSTNDFQGQNPQCLFLGKVLAFDKPNAAGTAVQQYQTFIVAGGRLDNNNEPIAPDPSNPTTPLDNDGPVAITQLTVQASVPSNLSVIDINQEPTAKEPSLPTQVFASGFSSNPSYGIGFMQNLGTTSQVGALNGSQPINIYYLSNLSTPPNPPASPSTVTGGTLTLLQPSKEIVMCVTDHKQYAYLEIGGASNQLNVRVKMLGANQCT